MRIRSKKIRALQQAANRPWQEVAQEWSQRPLSQTEIAQAWTALCKPVVHFSQQDVSKIVRRAEQETAQQ
jgi:hypothetical protein